MKLYAYTLPTVAEKSGWLKIGETNASVEKRVKQQGHELNLQTEIVWQDTIITERSHIDKMLHRWLEQQGFQIARFEDTGADSEWIKCDVDDVKKAYTAVKEQLHADEIKREEVGKKFYEEIRNWFYWTAKTGDDPYSVAQQEYSLRLIVRLLLCFFLREKGIIPAELFKMNWVEDNLKEDEYRYYNTILRNLFFHCLNTPIKDRKDFEYKKLIKNVSNVKEQFLKIPFLNGGLFNTHEGDDFALDNHHFFAEKHKEPILELGGDFPVEGLIRILSRYQFKTEVDLLDTAEYTKTIDPEFIGKVFESLLACMDADSKESRRKITGSFYTPREIVAYMVNESLDEYLKTNNELLNVKILDPACGSGAFPCGVMNEIIQRIDPNKELSQTERYRKKLEILRNVIYGVDIQPMAVQIAVFRLFLSLLQEIVPDKKKDNFGIEPLPNLETKFVCANTLIGLQQETQQRLVSPVVKNTMKSLLNNRNRYLMSHDKDEQHHLRQEDETLRETLSIALEDSGFLSHNNALRLAQWNPYDQTKSAEFFDPMWMFGVEDFDIVIGNPPWGAKYSEEQKKYFKTHYKSAKTSKHIDGTYKGSLDTFSLFTEYGYNAVKSNGYVMVIVPLSIIASENAALHRLLLQNCGTIATSSYSDRPRQVFQNGHRPVSIIGFTKTNTPNQKIFTTKLNRWYRDLTLQQLVDNLTFFESKKHYRKGRFARIENEIESSILSRLYCKDNVAVKTLKKKKGIPIFWRNADGGYYSLVLPHTTNSKYELSFLFDKKIAKVIGAILSSNLFFWHQKVYSDNYHLTKGEIETFPIPLSRLTDAVIHQIEKCYDEYVAEAERNVIVRSTKAYSTADTIREYKLMKSREFADKIDAVVCPLYGLTDEEQEFIRKFELEYRNYGNE